MSSTEPTRAPADESAAAVFYRRHRAAVADDAAISEKRMFGTVALCVAGKVFLFPWKDALVLKLPAPQVADLVASGDAVLFDPGHGRTSATWVAVSATAHAHWTQLAKDARAFVQP
jgi:hypothetical protein